MKAGLRASALILCGLAIVLLAGGVLAAELRFPALTGRVVDGAGLLSSAEEQRLTEALAAHERATTNQVVVVTLPSLQGTTIEDFGYRLGRHWALGQAGKDNGVLLLVAPKERAVRIEVGYGLEGHLTDAQSKLIIENVILPAFRDGRFGQGITAGTDAILRTIKGDSEPISDEAGRPGATARFPAGEPEQDRSFDPFFVIVIGLVIVIFISIAFRNRGDASSPETQGRRGLPDAIGRGGWTSDGSWSPGRRGGGFGGRGSWGGSWGGGIGRRSAGGGRRSSGSRSSGGGGGRFGGGGGSFGGGGASGGW